MLSLDELRGSGNGSGEEYNLYHYCATVPGIDILDTDDILQLLSPEAKRVLYLLLIGHTPTEVAGIVGVSVSRVNQLGRKIAEVIRGDVSDWQRKIAICRRSKEKEAAGKGCAQQSVSRQESQLIKRLLDTGAATKIKRPGDHVSDAPRRPRGRPRKVAGGLEERVHNTIWR